MPNRSARRPAIGIATAPPSKVAVMTQEALAGEVCSRRGSSVWIGITSVCIKAALIPPKHRTTTVSRADAGAWASAAVVELKVGPLGDGEDR